MWQKKGPRFTRPKLEDKKGVTRENWWVDSTVTTKKYTVINFIPKNLFCVQLMKMSNIYFIIIMIMQMIDEISITESQPAMLLPLVIVIMASMVKDAWEDY